MRTCEETVIQKSSVLLSFTERVNWVKKYKERGVISGNEKSCVCNVFATSNLKNPVNTGICSSPNDNLSSARDNSTEYRKRATNPENPVFSGFSLYSENLSDTLKTHENGKRLNLG